MGISGGDNGPPYIAWETRIFAGKLGLKPYFRSLRIPQSNRILAAFVKTLERDYIQISPLLDAKTALGLIAAWIKGYNESHPHSG